MPGSWKWRTGAREDDFLEEHDYSREEILEGLESLAEAYGLTER